MSTIDLDALERIAQAQESAYARMLDIGEGVGGLGVHHPDMFRDLLVWDDSSENEHADTVLALIARVRELEAIVNDGGNQAAKYWTRLAAAERALEAERANVKRAQAEALREAADEIEATFADPDRRRPRHPKAEVPTDYVNDPQWAELIVRKRADRIENEGAGAHD